MTGAIICLAAAGYVLAGMAVSADLAARLRLWITPRRFGRDDIAVITLAGILWPVTLLAAAWWAGYQWREQYHRRKGTHV